MFAYCKNNPVNMVDHDGDTPLLIPVLFIALQVIIDAATVAIGRILLYNSFHDSAKQSSISKAEAITHGNSKSSKKPQQGYEIYNKRNGDVVKCGISGGEIRKDGKSYRAEKQVRKFNRIEKKEIYESIIIAHFDNRAQALIWEEAHSQILWDLGHSMRYYKRPRPWKKK